MQAVIYFAVLVLAFYLILAIIKSLFKTIMVVLVVVVMIVMLRSMNTPVKIMGYVVKDFTITKMERNK